MWILSRGEKEYIEFEFFCICIAFINKDYAGRENLSINIKYYIIRFQRDFILTTGRKSVRPKLSKVPWPHNNVINLLVFKFSIISLSFGSKIHV